MTQIRSFSLLKKTEGSVDASVASLKFYRAYRRYRQYSTFLYNLRLVDAHVRCLTVLQAKKHQQNQFDISAYNQLGSNANNLLSKLLVNSLSALR